MSDFARDLATSRGIDARPRIEDFTGSEFDRVITSHALEHVTDPAAVLEGRRELIAPAGLLVVLVPMDDWPNTTHCSWTPDDVDMHLFAWTPLTLGNLLTVTGYEPVSIEPVKYPYSCFVTPLAKYSERAHMVAARAYGTVRRRWQILAAARPRS